MGLAQDDDVRELDLVQPELRDASVVDVGVVGLPRASGLLLADSGVSLHAGRVLVCERLEAEESVE